MNIFLDDMRMPGDVTWVTLPVLPDGESWTIVRNYNQFCDVIKRCMLTNTPVQRVCFDHDLADCHYAGVLGTEKDGSDCAKVLADACLACDWAVPEFVIHTMNPLGYNRVRAALDDIDRARAAINDWASMPHPWKQIP